MIEFLNLLNENSNAQKSKNLAVEKVLINLIYYSKKFRIRY